MKTNTAAEKIKALIDKSDYEIYGSCLTQANIEKSYLEIWNLTHKETEKITQMIFIINESGKIFSYNSNGGI